MTTVVYGPLRLPEPRRRWNVTCEHLAMDGGPVEMAALYPTVDYSRRPVPRPSLINRHVWRCAIRRETLAGGWVRDVCLNSTCRACPFAVDQ